MLAIKPGKGERSKEYEDICVEILKNVLGEYLGLWKVQESSNNAYIVLTYVVKSKMEWIRIL